MNGYEHPLSASRSPESSACRHGPARFELPPFAAIKPDHFPSPPSIALWPDHRAEIDAIAANPAPPSFDNTITAHWSEAAVTSSAWRQRILCAGRRRHVGRNRGHRARRLTAARAPQQRALPQSRRSMPGLRIFTLEREALDARMPNRPACWSAITPGSFALAPRWSGLRRIASRRSTSVWRASALSSARTCWRTRSPSRWSSDEGDLAGLPEFARAAARAAAEERGQPGKYAITLARSSDRNLSAVFVATRSARKRHSRPGSARGENGGTTDNRALIAEMVCAARGTGKAARLCELRRLPSRRPDGQDACRRRASCSMRSGAGRAQRPQSSATPCRRLIAEGGRQLRARTARLALLYRKAPQGAATI